MIGVLWSKASSLPRWAVLGGKGRCILWVELALTGCCANAAHVFLIWRAGTAGGWVPPNRCVDSSSSCRVLHLCLLPWSPVAHLHPIPWFWCGHSSRLHHFMKEHKLVCVWFELNVCRFPQRVKHWLVWWLREKAEVYTQVPLKRIEGIKLEDVAIGTCIAKVNQGWKAVSWALPVFLHDLKTLLALGETKLLCIDGFVLIEN